VATRRADPTTVVRGCTGTPYPCPDVDSVDTHIRKLRESIRRNPPRFPLLAQQWHADVDLLLERRHALTLLAPTATTRS